MNRLKQVYYIFLILTAFAFLSNLTAQVNISTKQFEVKMINDVQVSPNNKLVVFEAIGKLWKMKYPNGKPEMLFPNGQDFEYDASFSADGKKIIYCSWNTNGFGKLNELNVKENIKKTLLITSGMYKSPSYSKDGNMLVYKKELEALPTDTTSTKSEGLFLLPLFEKVDPIMLSAYGDYPQFDDDGTSVYYEAGEFRLGSFVKTFESVDLNGANKIVHYNGKYGHEYLFARDRKTVVWQELGKIYLGQLPDTNKKIGITAQSSAVEKIEVAAVPGNNLHWSHGGKKLHWLIANKYYTVDIKSGDKLKILETTIDLEAEKDIPKGVLAFTDARLITMDGEELIEHGTIIVKGNKIVDIGFDVKIPKEAFAINCSGKTIMPGFISLDVRSNNYDYKLNPLQQWEYIDYLRNGILTKLDGSFRIQSTLNNQELINTGKLVGPRLLCGGMRIVNYDNDLFSEDEYLHYKSSNLLLAGAYKVPAIIGNITTDRNNEILYLTPSEDTSQVLASDIHLQLAQSAKANNDNYKALYDATVTNSKKLGLDDYIGKLGEGMLADFIVLSANPLEDISNTAQLSYIIINGRVYDATTMDEVGNYRKRMRTKLDPSIFNSINRAAGSACCGFQH